MTASTAAETITRTYDLADNLLTETRAHSIGTGTERTLRSRSTYDSQGRLKKSYFDPGTGSYQETAQLDYNHRNEITRRSLGFYPASSSYLQILDYSYNTQCWLTGVNNWNTSATVNTPALCTPAMPNPASPARSTYNESSDLFMLDLRYDQPETGIAGLTAAPAQKAGNISQIIYRVRGREASIMSYSYDYLSRLSTSTFHNYSDAGVISGTNNYNENLTYDLRGNIQTLQRTGFYTNGSTCTYGQIDNLTYSYTANTNRLHKVLDGTVTAGDAKSRGFNGNLSTVDNSMTYDRNGNLNKNLHKNVSTITYNHLNLPTVITFTTGNTIEFLYDASGMKLRKTVKVGATLQYVQDYLPGGIEYRQTGTGVKRVESVFHAEGRYYNTNVDASNTIAWRREYNIKDHLGNTRLVFTDRNANGVVDITGTASTSDVLQENHYYAFGLAFEGAWLQNDATARDNRYQYNGKELNDDFGLNWNDYGARWYDAGIGRWNAVDPLAEKFNNWSSFVYALNNPISLVDLDGAEASIPFPLRGLFAVNKSEYTPSQLSDMPDAVVRTSTYQEIRNIGTSPHIGIDYRASVGTSFYSLGNGTVSDVGKSKSGIKYITVEYSNGDKIRFLHISKVAKGLKKGSKVYEGQELGKTGNSGKYQNKEGKLVSYAPHLHVDGSDSSGNPIDPEGRNYGGHSADEFFTQYGGDYQKLPYYQLMLQMKEVEPEKRDGTQDNRRFDVFPKPVDKEKDKTKN